MATSYGWTGKILRVDLTTGKITETPTSDYVPKLIGGRGVAAMIYWETVPPECAAFDPENALIMMTGVASGTLAPSASKFTIASKSPVPVKECYSYSNPSGHWSTELKFAGYDGIVVTGKSPKPVYLWVNDGEAELRDAGRLWGTTLSNMMLEVQNLHGPQARVLGIGPAGENLCRQAPIIVDREHATGITGAGAVMGSKNLKAIAVRGTGAVNVAKPQELVDLWYYYRRLLTRTPAEVAAGDGWPATNRSLSYYMYHGPHMPKCEGHPAKPTDPEVYFKNNGLDDPISLMREAVDAGTVKMKYGGCYGCPVCCALAYQSTDLSIPSGSGQCNDMESWPAYEWAGYEKVVGIPSIWYNRWCDDLGLGITNPGPGYHFYMFMDLINLGVLTPEMIGFPLESAPSSTYSELPQAWTLEFIRTVLEKIAYREGELYDAMAEGAERFLTSLAEKNPAAAPVRDRLMGHKGYYVIWSDSDAPSPGVSAIIEATDLRKSPNKTTTGMGKSFVASSAGLTDEQVAEIQKKGNLKYFGTEDVSDKSWDNKVSIAIKCQNLSTLMDCITYCGWAGAYSLYSTYNPPDYLGDWEIGAKVFSAVTGQEMTHEQMVEAMNPIWNIERAIHVREGRRREYDTFKDHVYESSSWEWTSKEEFEGEVLDEYYNDPARGWDLDTGIPRRSTLEAQGLKKIADELESKYGVEVPE